MAEEIIDLRDRIEKMRIQIENEATEQISNGKPLEIHQKTSNSNISLSLKDKVDESILKENFNTDSLKLKKKHYKPTETLDKKETFPSVSLSVKNPVSSKVLMIIILLQILSNVGILYFLYLGME
ncbi:hypothetical protein OAR00_00200 [Alphaproteobacteria bacterium]|nr:hypothetical protein [Alphaproteobacteria bacterium]MDC1022954.1 hypothetical protein [Alphaproteobacteria bacterium]